MKPSAPAETASPPPQDAYAPPLHLPAGAQAIWRREVWRFRELSFGRHLDLALFADYCRNQAIVEHCDHALDAAGMTYETNSKHGSMLRSRPEVGIRAQHQRLAMRCLEQLGLTTMARLRGRNMSAQPDLFTAQAPAEAPKPAATDPDSPIGYVN